MNVVQMEKGHERWSMVDENTWDMILGQQGSLLGPIADELKELAAKQGRSFFEGDPNELLEDQLPVYRDKMKEKAWDTGEDDEELFEYAMHPPQYEAYKSGAAKQKFEEELAAKRDRVQSLGAVPLAGSAKPGTKESGKPKSLEVEVNGEKYKVTISYPGDSVILPTPKSEAVSNRVIEPSENGHENFVTSPLEGKFYLTKEVGEKGVKVGDIIKQGEPVAYIEAMKVINVITSPYSGTVSEILIPHGSEVCEDDKLIKIV